MIWNFDYYKRNRSKVDFVPCSHSKTVEDNSKTFQSIHTVSADLISGMNELIAGVSDMPQESLLAPHR